MITKKDNACILNKKRMSFFAAPITNKVPSKITLNLFLLWDLIKSEEYRLDITMLRKIADAKAKRLYKGIHLPYVTIRGTFSYCSDDKLIEPTKIIDIDLDHLGDQREELFTSLLADPLLEPLLLFRSPTDGLKLVIENTVEGDPAEASRLMYTAVRNYMLATYNLSGDQVDPHCGNISRPCYLSWDPRAFLHPDFHVPSCEPLNEPLPSVNEWLRGL